MAVTFGVEEEFLLVDPSRFHVTARAREVLAEIPDDLRGHVHHELLETQIEVATPICRDLDELRWWLGHLRTSVAKAAERVGCLLMAAGTGPLDVAVAPPVAPGDRYARMAAEFGALLEVPGICACHVHVGVEDRDLAAAVSNHLRSWLPALHALCVNSPYAGGRDTGYASWRSVMVTRWPSSGPPPWLRSAAHHDQTVRDIIESGAMIDTRMVYWYARISPRYPTIEIRSGDVCATVDEAVLVAALARALVTTAVEDVFAGRCAPVIDEKLLQAAHWRAGRDGVEGLVLDPATGHLCPGWELVGRLTDRISGALAADGPPVADLLARVRASGSGAARQRAVYGQRHDLAAVARFLVAETLGALGRG